MTRRILISEPDPRTRLRLLAGLRTRFEILLPDDPTEDIVRAARRLRPDAILLGLPRGRIQPGLRTCRILKTDGARPPRVALHDRFDRLSEPESALTGCMGDGYLGGVANPGQLREFVDALLAGQRPIEHHRAEPGLLRRLLGRWG